MKYDIWHADMSKIIDGEAYGSVIPSCMLCVRILRIYSQARGTMKIATVTSDFLEKSRFVPAIFIALTEVQPQQKGRGAAWTPLHDSFLFCAFRIPYYLH